MQEEKFISEFWKSNERSNFSKEATVLFFYLIYIWKNENKPESSMCIRRACFARYADLP